MPKMPKDMSK
jgi:hypothetical protein